LGYGLTGWDVDGEEFVVMISLIGLGDVWGGEGSKPKKTATIK
jgi:hypothetical protein